MDLKTYEIISEVISGDEIMELCRKITTKSKKTTAETILHVEDLNRKLIETQMGTTEGYDIEIDTIVEIRDEELKTDDTYNRVVHVGVSAIIPIAFDKVEYEDYTDQEIIQMAINDVKENDEWFYNGTLTFRGREID